MQDSRRQLRQPAVLPPDGGPFHAQGSAGHLPPHTDFRLREQSREDLTSAHAGYRVSRRGNRRQAQRPRYSYRPEPHGLLRRNVGKQHAQRFRIRRRQHRKVPRGRMERRPVQGRTAGIYQRAHLRHRHLALSARHRKEALRHQLGQNAHHPPGNHLEETRGGQHRLSRVVRLYQVQRGHLRAEPLLSGRLQCRPQTGNARGGLPFLLHQDQRNPAGQLFPCECRHQAGRLPARARP